MQQNLLRRLSFWFILAVCGLAIVFDLPKDYHLKFQVGNFRIDRIVSGPDIDLSIGPLKIFRKVETIFGLDLKGGTHLVLEADMKDIDPADRERALESVRNILERRVNLFGVSEPIIQSARVGNSYRVIAELPGIQDVDKAIELIGKTAQLDFRETQATDASEINDQASPSAQVVEIASLTKETGLTGKHLKRSVVSFNSETGEPQVGLEFNSEGASLFEEITKRNVGKRVAIVLDGQIISAPRVNEVISGGNAVISGDFIVDQAKALSIQLNAGALPAPVNVIERRTIGATLGIESVNKSIRAGTIGLFFVAFFMIAYYGFLGFLATLALIVYGLLSLAIFRILHITLTLPGIAGFILSVGMAVDSNILIFERLKEELSSNKPWRIAMELGFGRAWDSIRDANITTLVTCFILFNPLQWSFLNTSGMVRGFAITLALGIFISLFTGVVVTRTLMRLFYQPRNNLLKK